MNIDMKYVMDFMVDILKVHSPSGDTAESLELLAKEFEAMGIKPVKTKKGALIGTVKGENDEDQKTIVAHIDTLGAVVKEIKANGRLKLALIGGFTFNSIEGENVIIKTINDETFTGSVMPVKASMHVHSDEVTSLPRTQDNVEVRIDEEVFTKEDVLNLGIRVGDYVYINARPVVTKSGYIKARYLDDKACVALLFGVMKYLKDNSIKPKYTTHFYISNYEELGHGVSVIPDKTTELLALDIGTVGEGQVSDEHSVCICAKDSRTPYDFGFRKKLAQLAEKNNINYKVDVYNRYGSDASICATQGFDVNFACIGPGVDATHHYERTHKDGVENTAKLIVKYITE